MLENFRRKSKSLERDYRNHRVYNLSTRLNFSESLFHNIRYARTRARHDVFHTTDINLINFLLFLFPALLQRARILVINRRLELKKKKKKLSPIFFVPTFLPTAVIFTYSIVKIFYTLLSNATCSNCSASSWQLTMCYNFWQPAIQSSVGGGGSGLFFFYERNRIWSRVLLPKKIHAHACAALSFAMRRWRKAELVKSFIEARATCTWSRVHNDARQCVLRDRKTSSLHSLGIFYGYCVWNRTRDPVIFRSTRTLYRSATNSTNGIAGRPFTILELNQTLRK